MLIVCQGKLQTGHSKSDFTFVGFLLDVDRDENMTEQVNNRTLHPIFKEEKPLPDRTKEIVCHVLAGKKFERDCKVGRGGLSGGLDEVTVEWVVERKLLASYSVKNTSLVLDSGELSIRAKEFGGGVVFAKNGLIDDVIPLWGRARKYGLALREKMIICLALAAGIRSEDEKSDDFPLLLEQLKRIKAEGKI